MGFRKAEPQTCGETSLKALAADMDAAQRIPGARAGSNGLTCPVPGDAVGRLFIGARAGPDPGGAGPRGGERAEAEPVPAIDGHCALRGVGVYPCVPRFVGPPVSGLPDFGGRIELWTVRSHSSLIRYVEHDRSLRSDRPYDRVESGYRPSSPRIPLP